MSDRNNSLAAGAWSALTRRIDLASLREHRNIFSGLAFVSTFIVIAKIFGALKEVAVAARYGTNPAIDAYVYIFNLISWPLAVWTGTLGVVLIPLFVRANRERLAELVQFEREFFSFSVITGIGIGILGALSISILIFFSLS